MRRRPRGISSWCRRSSSNIAFSSEVGTVRVKKTRQTRKCGDDEKAYQAYMNYLDAMERQGKAADPDKAIDAVLDALEANMRTRPKQDDPANDKTLSPFFCSPINNK